MRKAIPFLVVLFLSPPAFSQSIEFGVKGGIPLSRYFRTAHRSDPSGPAFSTAYSSMTNRYTVGPTIEVRLPRRIGVEVDVLYKHYQFAKSVLTSTSGTYPPDLATITKTTADALTVPMLLKYHASDLPVGMFVEVGPAIQWGSKDKETRTTRYLYSPIVAPDAPTNPLEGVSYWHVNPGFVMGGGIEFRVKSLKVSPGVRTTMLAHKTFFSTTSASFDGLLGAEQNQVEFLMGITF